MFIVTDQKGNIYKETKIVTWDSLPKDIKIAQLQLTFPLPIFLREKSNKKAKTFAPLLTIGKFDRYYFFNEAVYSVLIPKYTQEDLEKKEVNLVAKVVGGIDDKLGLVIETRVDRSGNCTIHRYSLLSLQSRINAKTFRAEIIKKGI